MRAVYAVTAPDALGALKVSLIFTRELVTWPRINRIMSIHTPAPSVSYTFTARLTYPNRIGMFTRIAQAIGQHGWDLGAVDIVASDAKAMTRDITVRARDAAHQEEIIAAMRQLAGAKVVNVSDRVFLLHLGGKIAIQNKVPLTTRDALSMTYTAGVARICEAVAAQPRRPGSSLSKGTLSPS